MSLYIYELFIRKLSTFFLIFRDRMHINKFSKRENRLRVLKGLFFRNCPVYNGLTSKMGLNQLGKQLEQVIQSSIPVLYWFIEELMLLNNSLVRFCCHWVDILKCLLDKRGSFTQTCSKQQDVYNVCVEFVY